MTPHRSHASIFGIARLIMTCSLALDAAEGDALHEGALGEEEEDDDGEGDDGGAGHEESPATAVGPYELLQADGDGVVLFVVEVQKGADEVVPVEEEGK